MNYGNLRKKIPYTFWAMMIGTLAITGVGIPLTHIGFAGYLSKDAIIESAYAGTNGGYAFWMLVIAALFTSFYSWRLMFLTFYGEARGDKHTHEHAHESPNTMLIPLGVLAVGAVLAGMVWALENPQAGIVEADEMDYRRCLEVQMPYLGPVSGHYTDWTPLEGRPGLFEEDLDRKDPWQFRNILVR